MVCIIRNFIFLALWAFMMKVSNVSSHPEPPDNLAIRMKSSLCGKIHLNLVRINSLLANENLPLFATSHEPGSKYTELDGNKIMNEIGEFAMYHDYETRSAFVYFRETGLLNGIVNVVFHVEGIHINDLNKVQKVRPTKSKYFNWLLSKKSFKLSRDLRSTSKTNITKIRTRREYPDHIPNVYPELLVAISYDMFKAFGKNFHKTISHILTIYNGVDMLYKLVRTVNVQINIAAIVFELSKNTWSFIPRVNVGRNVRIDGRTVNNVLSQHFKYHEDYFPRDSYDYIVYNTRRTIKSAHTNMQAHGVSAQASPDTIFPFNKDDDYNRLNLAVTDYKGYESYSTIAHELAHIFGAKHDEDVDEFNSQSCRGDKFSSIMTADCSELTLDWSENTEREFTKFFSSSFSCNLRNYPLSLLPSPRKSRIVLTGLDQCKCYGHHDFTTPVYYTPDWCNDPLHCIDVNSQIVNNLPLPFDGTPCGPNNVCWQKSCVKIEVGAYV